MTIQYYQRELYGKIFFYIKDKKQAYLMYLLTGRKTLSKQDFAILKEFDIDMVEVLRN